MYDILVGKLTPQTNKIIITDSENPSAYSVSYFKLKLISLKTHTRNFLVMEPLLNKRDYVNS